MTNLRPPPILLSKEVAAVSVFPETIMQFGSGKFLRGFADLFFHQANQDGQGIGRIVVVQTTGDARAKALAQQGGRYHVLVRGLWEGAIVERVEESASISRALVASQQWNEVLALARSADLRLIISNTAEAGYTLDPADRVDSAPPVSFPAKLLLVLNERFRAGRPPVTIIPCELFEKNADTLQSLLLRLSGDWKLPTEFQDWLRVNCSWRNTLVDRIVVNPPSDDPRLAGDEMAVATEPYSLWAIEVKDGSPGPIRHPAVRITNDVMPFFLRKVRILNGAHTALLSQALPKGYRLVREAVNDPAIVEWLQRLLFEEIVPVLVGRVEEPEQFARQTLERFRNPFLDHKLSDIAAYHEKKVPIRLTSTRDEFVAKFGRVPPLLENAIAYRPGE
jgi:tagaturonate reductase